MTSALPTPRRGLGHYDLIVPSDPHRFSRAMSDLRADLHRYKVLSGQPTYQNLWLSPGTIASIHYRVAHWAWSSRSPWHLLCGFPLIFAQRLVEVWSGVGISPQAVIGPGLYIGHFGQVIVNGECRDRLATPRSPRRSPSATRSAVPARGRRRSGTGSTSLLERSCSARSRSATTWPSARTPW